MNLIDRVLGYFDPVSCERRLVARARIDSLEKVFGTKGGYDAGKKNRLNAFLSGQPQSENAVDRGQLLNLRTASWQLFRNSPQAKKIVRQIEVKTIGRGMGMQSQAMLPSGQPAVAFRELASDLWQQVQGQLDYRGRPGYGGQTFAELCKTALRGVVLGGDCFLKIRLLSDEERRERRLILPLVVQLIHAERVRGDNHRPEGQNVVFDGVEINPATGIRAAYWVSQGHPSDPTTSQLAEKFTRIPAGEMGHVYVAEDVDQIRGTPWFAPIINQLRDTGDYQHNEITSAKLRACIAWAWRPGVGNTTGFPGTNQPGGGSPTSATDGDGNPITAMQPGILLNMGSDGEVVNLAAPANDKAEEFAQFMLRQVSAGAPGIKGSTLTGDYRGSSFASERSADNEIWPEIEVVQDWFADQFVRPIYEAVIRTGFLMGWFRGSEFAPVDLRNNAAEILAAAFQGPVPRSINPKDDAEASGLLIKGGLSSPQIEAAKRGVNWQQALKDRREFLDYAASLEMDEDDTMQMLGVEPEPVPAGGADAQAA